MTRARTGGLASAIVVLLLSTACTGTRTGNPVSDGGPKGAKLLRSALEREEAPDVDDGQRAQLGSDQRAFAMALYKELASASATENLFVSPYSIWVALAMTYAGAEGETEREMASALRFGLGEPELHTALNAAHFALAERPNELPGFLAGRENEGMTLEITNALFGQAGVKAEQPFLDTLASSYGTGLYTIDFGKAEAARHAINEWVAKRTGDRIAELLPEDSLRDAAFVLVNALFFKATWLTPFDESATADGVFHGANGDVRVPMMHGSGPDTRLGASMRYLAEDGYEAIELPYVSPAVRMLIVLPEAARFDEVQAAFDGPTLSGLLPRLAAYDVNLQMPKFSFDSSFDLRDALSRLGMERAFGSTADFSGITTDDQLQISLVQHQAFIAVDEEGTEATAATAVVTAGQSAPPPLPEVAVVVDRPFMFAIYDEPTGLVLFLGRVMDPSR